MKDLKIHREFFENDLLEENYFDAVILTHVFEHLPDPLDSIKTITRIADDNATLQIEIPSIDSWQYKLFKVNWFHLDPPRHRHLNMFPVEVLKGKITEQGWELISEQYFSVQFSPFGMHQSLLNLILKKREVLNEHLKNNSDYTNSYSNLSLFLQKLFHWVSFPFFVLLYGIASIFKKGSIVKLIFTKIETKEL